MKRALLREKLGQRKKAVEDLREVLNLALKGALDLSTQVSTFIGYTIAAYNRLAAVLNGSLHFEYTGRGIYFSNFISFNMKYKGIVMIC